jgi:alkyl sulfatase BDS1-like metallo-beta-lactamase superfamily hydrolase
MNAANQPPIGPGPATEKTAAANRKAGGNLPANSASDFEEARRGFIATLPNAQIQSQEGDRIIWNLEPYSFLEDEQPPPTVHPSLWRQARLNTIHGLFEVVPGIYQIRGFDLANMTLVESDTGVIVIDTLVTIETARAGLELYRQHRGNRPVVAVIYTHSHSDHFGGVRGVLTEAQIGTTPIIAPEHFLMEAISESVFAGTAMSRRALYFSGAMLPRGPRGQVDAGLGKSVSTGSVSLIPPTDIIKATGDRRVIDGVEIVFQMAPDTEAPAEMLMHFPQFKALCAAEVACPLMHNIYTPRGAQVRNARNWWRALNQAVDLFGDQTTVMFGQHHWPRWGAGRIISYLKKQRDLYKFLHDQTLHFANKGLTPNEIGEAVKLPEGLTSEWFLREYYGTATHNARGVYQRYLGWYDGNPANLNPLAPSDAGARYVEFMGGAAQVIAKARKAYDEGDYRWVAQVMNHVVFAEPGNADAKALQADALEQLGYLSESAVWRNMYLMGAHELRNGIKSWGARRTDRSDYVRAMPSELLLDYMGIRLNSEKANGLDLTIGLTIKDTGERFLVELTNSVLSYTSGKPRLPADVTVALTRAALNAIANGAGTLDDQLAAVECTGDQRKFRDLLGCLDTFDGSFPIVLP